MRSMKTYMPVLLLGLLTLMVGTATAQNSQLLQPSTSLTAPAGPCSSGSISGTGTTHVVYQQNGTHYVVHFNFDGTATDPSNNNSYTVSLAGTGQNPTIDSGDPASAVVYIFPYQGTFTSQGSAASFNLSGDVKVLVVNGVPTDDILQSGTTSCQN